MEKHPVDRRYNQRQWQRHIVQPPVYLQAPWGVRLVTGLLHQAPGVPQIKVPAGDLNRWDQHCDRAQPVAPVGHVDKELAIAELNDNAHDIYAQEDQGPDPSIEQVHGIGIIFLPLFGKRGKGLALTLSWCIYFPT